MKYIMTMLGFFALISPVYSQSTKSKNEILAFLYQWFSLMDDHAKVELLLPKLATKDLLIKLPVAKFTKKEEFARWYIKMGKTSPYKNPSHELKNIKIAKKGGGKYQVDFEIIWRAQLPGGKKISMHVLEDWLLITSPKGELKIKRYIVTATPHHHNKLKRQIIDLKTSVYGGFITIASPKIIENLAVAGHLDFVWIEAEHSEMGPTQVQTLVRTAENEKLIPIIRVPKNDIDEIKKYIGTGAMGIVIPAIKTAQDAKKAIAALKYPPEGQRPAGVERANRYLGKFLEYKSRANKMIMTILMIETKEAVANIEQIAAVKGIDILHIGPYDLSLSMGVEMGSTQLQKAISKVEKVAKKHHIFLGGYAANIKIAKEKEKRGYRFFTIPGDMQLLQNGVKSYFSGRKQN